MFCTSILDCFLDFAVLEPMALVGAVCAVEDFAVGEKLILVWRFGALDRLRAISGFYIRGESVGCACRCVCAPSRCDACRTGRKARKRPKSFRYKRMYKKPGQ